MEAQNYLIFFLITSIFFFFIIYKNKKKIANYLNVNDIPDAKRKKHENIIPKTASYSIVVNFILLIFFDFKLDLFNNDLSFMLLSVLACFFVGFLDDKIYLSPYLKIILLTIILLPSVLFIENLIIKEIYLVTFNKSYFLNEYFSIIFTILATLLLINAFNLSDGVNGLAIGIAFFWLLHLSFIVTQNSYFFVFIIITMFNLILIFYHNFRGNHFLGDSGSIMIPALIAFLVIQLSIQGIEYRRTNFLSAEEIFILFMLPGLDMFRLFIERIFRKKNPFYGDRNHLHHFLLNRYNLKKTLLIYFILLNVPIILTWYLKFNSLIVIFIFVSIYLASILYLKKN